MKITSTTTTPTARQALALLDRELRMADLQSMSEKELALLISRCHHWGRLAECEKTLRRRPAPALTLAPFKPAA